MKVLIVALCLVAGAFARSAVQESVFAEGPACPIEDPLNRDGPLPLNVTLPPIVEFALGSEIRNLRVNGLSSLHYNIDINALLLTASFEVTIESVNGDAVFTIVTGYVDARPLSDNVIPSGNVTATAAIGVVSATRVHLKGSATLFVNLIGNKVTVRVLNLETVSFASLNVDFGSLTVNGKTVDWAALSANIKANFDKEFAEHKTAVTDKVRLAANNIIGQYTLAELIDLIGSGGDGEDCETSSAKPIY